MKRLLALAAPAVFVLIWSTGFVGARYGLPYAPPFALLAIRLAIAAAFLALLTALLRSTWPTNATDYRRSALIGVLLHTGYLGGVFVAIDMGLPLSVTVRPPVRTTICTTCHPAGYRRCLSCLTDRTTALHLAKQRH